MFKVQTVLFGAYSEISFPHHMSDEDESDDDDHDEVQLPHERDLHMSATKEPRHPPRVVILALILRSVIMFLFFICFFSNKPKQDESLKNQCCVSSAT